MTSREVARASSLPVGGSAAADSGSAPYPVGIDHTHSFWKKWVELPMLAGWKQITGVNNYPLMMSLCGNMVWLRGRCRWKGRISGSTEPSRAPVARLPKIAIPDRQIVYESLLIDTDGYLYTPNFQSSYGVATGASWVTVSDFFVDDLIYRTKL